MTLQKTLVAITACLALCVPAVAQQSDSSSSPATATNLGSGKAKKPAAAARGVSSSNSPDQYDPSQVEPDTNTLSGAEAFGVGSLQHSRNIFDPSLTFSSLGQSGLSGIGTVGQTGFVAVNMFGGSMNFNRIWDRYHFAATYNGAETLYQGPLLNSSFHNLSVAQEIDLGRWRLHLRDDFSSTPGTGFGGSGTGGPGLIGQLSAASGTAPNSIAGGFSPGGTIQTGLTRQYLNTILAEAEYSLSRRSSFTFSGSYGILDFSDPHYLSNHLFKVQGGYDYLLDPRNSIAILGSYSKTDFIGTVTSTADYVASLAYGRKITGRMAFQATAGPQEIRVLNSGFGNFQFLTWTASTALTYERRRTGFSLGFGRGAAGGSGVLFGSLNNTFTSSVHHRFTRFWSAAATGGYAFNSSLAPAGVATTSFTNWFIGGNVGRQLGRHAQVAFNYGLNKQNSPAACPVTSCGVTGYQQTIGMTVNWHLRPVE